MRGDGNKDGSFWHTAHFERSKNLENLNFLKTTLTRSLSTNNDKFLWENVSEFFDKKDNYFWIR